MIIRCFASLALSAVLCTIPVFALTKAPKKIVVLTGVPGSGKSTIIKGLQKNGVKGLYISFGSEMKKLYPNTDRDSMRKQTPQEQIEKAKIAATNIRKALEDSPFDLGVVDTHALIIGADGKYIEGLSDPVVTSLKPDRVIFINPESSQILTWRGSDKSRNRDHQTVVEIERHQSDCIAFLKKKFGSSAFFIKNQTGKSDQAVHEIEEVIKKIEPTTLKSEPKYLNAPAA